MNLLIKLSDLAQGGQTERRWSGERSVILLFCYDSLFFIVDVKSPGSNSLVHSHWSRNVEARLSLVESNAAPALFCHKEPARRNTPPLLGGILLAPRWFFLWHKRDRWLPWTERIYYRRPYAIKNQRRGSKIPPTEPAISRKCPGHQGGPVWDQIPGWIISSFFSSLNLRPQK